MHKIILKIRELRNQGAFKASTRLVIVLLMSIGLYVGTMPLSAPSLGGFNDKLIHLFVFFSFAMLMDLSTSRKPSWLWKGLPLLFYGVLIEVMQSMTAYRSFELADIAANMLGILAYFVIKKLLKILDESLDKTS